MSNINNPNIRCRFAPSPTGSLHVGGARTALFNYLFAKQSGGSFVLRIEDTDTLRSTPEAVQTIINGLRWLGIKEDEGPFFQSERMSIYKSYAKKLLEIGAAYPCTCSTETLEKVREEQKQNNQKPQYNRLHRPKEKSSQPLILPTGKDEVPFVIRLRAPEDGKCIFNDLIIGEVQTPYSEIDDFIIFRSDGTPTYNFTVVVDDIDMKISHVIRGMDHVSNTPKQLVIYEALGEMPPLFAHVPMILGPDKKKLSKRHGATSVFEYKKEGYLSNAFVNYLARLGWSCGDKEIFTREELETFFELKNVGKSDAVFDTAKLVWVNSEHMKTSDAKDIAPFILDFLGEEKDISLPENINFPIFCKLIDSLKERTKTLVELSRGCLWYFHTTDSLPYDNKAVAKFLGEKSKPALKLAYDRLSDVEEFTEQTLEQEIQKIVAELGIKLGELAQPLRVALSGSSVSPPIYAVLEILGKEESLKRIENGLKK